MKLRGHLILITVFMLLFTWADLSLSIQVGDPFPVFSAHNNLTPEDLSALGIEGHAEFSSKDLKQDILVIEFLNVYCHTCREQVQVFNELFSTLQKDTMLKKKVALLGIGVGNSAGEIEEFKKTFGAAYPILADPQKTLYTMTGNIRGTPHTYILGGAKEKFVLDYHAGAVSSLQRYLRAINSALRGDITGNELGNLSPAYSFTYKGQAYSQKSFEGQKVLLYFPVAKNYPLSNDTRNPQIQLEILAALLKEFPEVHYIIFNRDVLPSETLAAMQHPRLYLPEQVDERVFTLFDVKEDPRIYYINQYQRISFSGPSITLFNAAEIFKGKEYKTAPQQSQQEITKLIEAELEQLGAKVLHTEKITLENGKDLYVSTLAPLEKRNFLFARVESKLSVCDICHDSHFIYIFDQAGIIKGFIPLALTKYGNVPWTENDKQKIVQKIVGKSIFDDFTFRPKVDAVSTATMTSSLIYEALEDAKHVFADFKDFQFRKEYWQTICFANICSIKRAMQKMAKQNLAPIIDGSRLNYQEMQKFLPGEKIPICPLQGLYIALEKDIICTIHGMNVAGCQP